jgi:hypothetical protein
MSRAFLRGRREGGRKQTYEHATYERAKAGEQRQAE